MNKKGNKIKNINTDKKIEVSELSKDEMLATSARDITRKEIEQAIYNYQARKHTTSSYYGEDYGNSSIDISELDNLAFNAQNDLEKIKKINQIVRQFINKGDLMGKVYETIESNINTDFKLTYSNYDDSKSKKYKKVETVINNFNDSINIKNLIIKSIPMTFAEGNYCMYLRKDIKNKQYGIDYYPLGVVEVSDYECDGEPYIVVNVNELTSKLRKTYRKNKKNQPLFFKNLDEEIKSNYPKEIYTAYMNKEQYAKLDITNTGIMRINNMNRKYGLTPMFKALEPTLKLKDIEHSDNVNSKVRGKKIIHQSLDKELLTKETELDITWSEGLITAQEKFIEAWNNNPSIYTSPPWVEKIEYIEPNIGYTDINTINHYRNEIATSLGISFLVTTDKSGFAQAQLTISELMKTINKITSQLSDIIEKWYKGVLKDNKLDVLMCPKIQITNSELLETELKLKLATTLFDKLGMSYQSAYQIMGFDYETEKKNRQDENKDKIDEKVFYARENAFTHSGSGTDTTDESNGGRPSGTDDSNNTTDIDRTITDKERRDAKGE